MTDERELHLLRRIEELILENAKLRGSLRAPLSVDEAELMEKLGFAYLKEHAPERLTVVGQNRTE